MTLNKTKTRLLNAFICEENALLSLSVISDTDYNTICDEVEEWETAYNNQNLYGTAEDNTTFQFAGIDQFPRPEKRA